MTPQNPEYFGNLSPHEIEVARIRQFATKIFNPETLIFLGECQNKGLNLEGEMLLILGVGPGATLEVWKNLQPGKINGVDTNVKMLEEAANRLGIGNIFQGIEGKVENLGTLIEPGSVKCIESRLLWQHIPATALKQVADQVVDILKSGGALTAEDLNLSTWRLEPRNEANEKILEDARIFYQRRTANWDMGGLLTKLFRDSGLKIVHTREYASNSRENPDMVITHKGILQSMGRGIIAMGIQTKEEFDQYFAEVLRALEDPGTIVTAPIMSQVCAVKT